MENIITKDTLIRNVAKRANTTITNVREIYNTLEDVIFDTLSSVNEDNDVSIKVFNGITLDGTYMPEKTKRNNLTGEESFVESKIKLKCNITRSYCEKLNSN